MDPTGEDDEDAAVEGINVSSGASGLRGLAGADEVAYIGAVESNNGVLGSAGAGKAAKEKNAA